MPKSNRITRVMAQQIEQGDYRSRRFPSIRQIARDLGVNPRTVTKAANELVDQGLLVRNDQGRFLVSSDSPSKTLHLTLLMPSFDSPYYPLHLRSLQQLTVARGWQIKPITYSHWHDAAIYDAMQGFDGVFFLPLGEDMPDDVLKLIKEAPRPVVVMDQDVSAHEVPCMGPYDINNVSLVLDELLKAGHQRVICLNTQPMDTVIRQRIEHWQGWCKLHKIEGRLIDEHSESFSDTTRMADTLVRERLAGKRPAETAMFCTTGMSALGAIRGLADIGIEPGYDMAICAGDSCGELASFIRPSITSLYVPNRAPYYEVFLDWFANGGQDWVGPYMVRPSRLEVFVGESTTLFKQS